MSQADPDPPGRAPARGWLDAVAEGAWSVAVRAWWVPLLLIVPAVLLGHTALVVFGVVCGAIFAVAVALIVWDARSPSSHRRGGIAERRP